MNTRHAALAILLGMALAACSLAGDITPPPGARPFRPLSATPIPATIAANLPATPDAGIAPVSLEPDFRPSAAAGAPIYAEKCADCHGPTGQGDGVRAAQIPAGIPVPKFADPGLGREATPQEWFDVVTNGRLERFMPPFNQSLSDADRWNVVAYLITLAVPPEQIEKGQAMYEANCAACHGSAGQGDGPRAQGALTDLSSPAFFASRTPNALLAAIGADSPIPEHAFDRALSETERWAVVDYVRTLAYDYAAPDTALVAEAPAQTRTLAGVIRNGTLGAAVPPNLSVNLIGLDPGFGVMTTLTVTADATGAFIFRDVPVTEGRQFVVATDYDGVTYYSPVTALDGSDAQLTVYERTNDAGALRIERIHTFILFETQNEVTIGQLVIVNNFGDRTFAPPDGRTVTITLPPGARDLNVQDGQEGVTFFRTEAGFADTAPVVPGRGAAQLLYSFKLPWNGALEFVQPLPYPVDNVNVLVGDMNVTLTGPQFGKSELQDVQGMPFQNYARAGLTAGEPLTFRLSSDAMAGVANAIGNFLGGADTSGLALGASVLGLTLLVLGVWWWRQQAGGGRRTADRIPAARIPATRIHATRSRDELLDAIAELDDDYAAGKVSRAEYERERAWLKNELKKVWK
jgi:mono/diheme cytochrome c family protein